MKTIQFNQLTDKKSKQKKNYISYTIITVTIYHSGFFFAQIPGKTQKLGQKTLQTLGWLA